MSQSQSRLGLLTTGLLLGILVAAMDNTIVSTAMGTIVSELGGMDSFVWVTSAYLVAGMAAMPIIGKLSDMYGRKRFFVFGIILFLVGSALCGTAGTITELSIYRAIQGIGGGAMMPIAFTIMFDSFPPEKRGVMGGLFGAVYGVASLAGPLLGAFITDHWGWGWVFYINLPVGVISLLMILVGYHESPVHSRQKIDFGGALTLVGSVVSLMFALELGGNIYDWDSPVILGLFVAFACLLILFVLIEKRAEEPVISFSMFHKRLYAMSNLSSLFYGAAFIAATVYIPIFVQGVTGGNATSSGLILLPMTLSSTITASLGGMLVQRMSFRNVMVGSAIIFAIGLLLLGTLTPDTSRTLITLYMVIAGLGVGFSFSVFGMSAIQEFGPQQRGAASSTVSFVRTLGMTVGITVFGIIQRGLFQSHTSGLFGGGAGDGAAQAGLADPRALLSPEVRKSIPSDALDSIISGLSGSISEMFLWSLIPAGLALVSVCFMGRARMTDETSASNVVGGVKEVQVSSTVHK